MAEHEPEVARAVAALRAKRSPPADAKARVHALLEARLGDPGPGDGEGEGEGEGGGGASHESGSGSGGASPSGAEGLFAAKVVGATAALTAGGLLVLKLSTLAVHSLTAGFAHAPAITERAPVEVASAPAPVEPIAAPEPVVEAPSSPAPDSAPVVARRKRAAAPTDASVSSPEPDISAELALIDAARRADTPAAAIVQLREHVRRFPTGMLRDEREALWAIASCERKDFADASRRAKELAKRRPSSPLLDRVAAACPDLEP